MPKKKTKSASKKDTYCDKSKLNGSKIIHEEGMNNNNMASYNQSRYYDYSPYNHSIPFHHTYNSKETNDASSINNKQKNFSHKKNRNQSVTDSHESFGTSNHRVSSSANSQHIDQNYDSNFQKNSKVSSSVNSQHIEPNWESNFQKNSKVSSSVNSQHIEPNWESNFQKNSEEGFNIDTTKNQKKQCPNKNYFNTNKKIGFESREDNFHTTSNTTTTYENQNSKKSFNSDKPTPLPRTLINKNSNDNKGARKKERMNANESQSKSWICVTCDKIMPQKQNHSSDHQVVPLNLGIKELKAKEQNKVQKTIEEASKQLKQEMQLGDLINSWYNSINTCLSAVFNELKISNELNTEKLLQTQDKGSKILKDSCLADSTDLLKFIDYKDTSSRVIRENQMFLSSLHEKPNWLVFSWFKISYGLIIQSGKRIFASVKSESSTLYAPFELHGDRLSLFSFRRNITPDRNDVVLPFESISSLLEYEDSKCFMKLSHNKDEKGHIFMRINRETFWGEQFLSLCLGNLGPSLRNTCFFRSCGKGKLGHHIWGGDYSQNDGSGGQAIIKCNTPPKPNPEPIVRGLIAARYGVNDKSTIFRIFIQGDQQQTAAMSRPMSDNFGFGHIEEGMENLDYFSNSKDITKLIIEDTGCFLVLK